MYLYSRWTGVCRDLLTGVCGGAACRRREAPVKSRAERRTETRPILTVLRLNYAGENSILDKQPCKCHRFVEMFSKRIFESALQTL